MKRYETPVMEAELIEAEDIILASGSNGPTDDGEGGVVMPDMPGGGW